jgi:hypothetical protein
MSAGTTSAATLGSYVNEAALADGPILELASEQPRARSDRATGKRIVGVEQSRQMLDRCREKVAPSRRSATECAARGGYARLCHWRTVRGDHSVPPTSISRRSTTS